MKFTDIDWRLVLNEFNDADLQYLKTMIDEKLERTPITRRRAIIQ
jgi:hypothetical protein